MHPLVRNLYKEVLHVARDYPLGLDKVKAQWKKAIRNPKNCPSCYRSIQLPTSGSDDRKYASEPTDSEAGTRFIPKRLHSKEYPNPECEKELRKAVAKGRYMIREMIGIIQLKKYRSLKERYDDNYNNSILHQKLRKLQEVEYETCSDSKDDRI